MPRTLPLRKKKENLLGEGNVECHTRHPPQTQGTVAQMTVAGSVVPLATAATQAQTAANTTSKVKSKSPLLDHRGPLGEQGRQVG